MIVIIKTNLLLFLMYKFNAIPVKHTVDVGWWVCGGSISGKCEHIYHFRNNAGQPPKTHTPLFCISQLFSFKFSNNRITLSLFVPRGFCQIYLQTK